MGHLHCTQHTYIWGVGCLENLQYIHITAVHASYCSTSAVHAGYCSTCTLLQYMHIIAVHACNMHVRTCYMCIHVHTACLARPPIPELSHVRTGVYSEIHSFHCTYMHNSMSMHPSHWPYPCQGHPAPVYNRNCLDKYVLVCRRNGKY